MSTTETAPGAVAAASRGGRWRAFTERESVTGLAFVSPFIIGFIVFSAIPMIASLVLSLTDFDPREPDQVHFIGLDNYAQMLSDPVLHQSLGVTVRVRPPRRAPDPRVRPRRRDAREQQAARGPDCLPDALLHADADPDRRQHDRLDRRPPRHDRLVELRPRGRSASPAPTGSRAPSGSDRRSVSWASGGSAT